MYNISLSDTFNENPYCFFILFDSFNENPNVVFSHEKTGSALSSLSAVGPSLGGTARQADISQQCPENTPALKSI